MSIILQCPLYYNAHYITLNHTISLHCTVPHCTALHYIKLHSCFTHHNNTRQGAPSGAENGLGMPFTGDNKIFLVGTVVEEVVSDGLLELVIKSRNISRFASRSRTSASSSFSPSFFACICIFGCVIDRKSVV